MTEHLFQSLWDTDYRHLEEFLEGGGLGDLIDWDVVRAEQDRLIDEKGRVHSGGMFVNFDIIDQAPEQLEITRQFLPTRYDSPTQYAILYELAWEIFASARDCEITIDPLPKIGTIPTGKVNARALRLHDLGPVYLLFDSQSFTFLHLFAKAITNLLPLESYEGGIAQHCLDPQVIDTYLERSGKDLIFPMMDLLNACVVHQRPASARQYYPEECQHGMIDALRDGMELFLVAHELGHFAKGHLSGNIPEFIWQQQAAGEIEASHKAEHEADLIGFRLTYHSLRRRGYDRNFSYIGCDLFFTSLMLWSRYDRLLKGERDPGWQDSSSISHPSSFVRRRLLRRFYLKSLKTANNEKGATRLIDCFDRTLHAAWSLLEKWSKTP